MTGPRVVSLRAAGRLVGRLLAGDAGEISLSYEPGWLRTSGAYPLSSGLPLRAEPHSGERVERWIEGQLPYGGLRRQVEEALGLDADESAPNLKALRLLARLGGDAPGAVSFTLDDGEPKTEGAAKAPPGLRLVKNLGALIDYWSAAPLSLADGVSHTLCEESDERLPVHLSDHADPRIALALGGAPSTHLLWLEPKSTFGALENRVFHQALAAAVGLAVCGFRTFAGAGRRMLLSPRDDRLRRGKGWVRLHRETLAQALGATPAQRYGREPGPFSDLETIFRWADGVMPARERLRLLDAFLFNALIGAPDAHLMRYAIRLQPGPALAPLQELAAPGFPPPQERRFAQRVGGVSRWPERISAAQWRAFAEVARLNGTFTLDRMIDLAEGIVSIAEPVARKLEADPHLQGAILGRFARAAKERAADTIQRLKRPPARKQAS